MATPPRSPKGAVQKGPYPPNPAGRGSNTARYPAHLKDMIMTALHKAGGVKYLTQQAQKNPTAFMTLLGKVLPLHVKAEGPAPLPVVTLEHLRGLSDNDLDRLIAITNRIMVSPVEIDVEDATVVEDQDDNGHPED